MKAGGWNQDPSAQNVRNKNHDRTSCPGRRVVGAGVHNFAPCMFLIQPGTRLRSELMFPRFTPVWRQVPAMMMIVFFWGSLTEKPQVNIDVVIHYYSLPFSDKDPFHWLNHMSLNMPGMKQEHTSMEVVRDQSINQRISEKKQNLGLKVYRNQALC